MVYVSLEFGEEPALRVLQRAEYSAGSDRYLELRNGPISPSVAEVVRKILWRYCSKVKWVVHLTHCHAMNDEAADIMSKALSSSIRTLRVKGYPHEHPPWNLLPCKLDHISKTLKTLELEFPMTYHFVGSWMSRLDSLEHLTLSGCTNNEYYRYALETAPATVCKMHLKGDFISSDIFESLSWRPNLTELTVELDHLSSGFQGLTNVRTLRLRVGDKKDSNDDLLFSSGIALLLQQSDCRLAELDLGDCCLCTRDIEHLLVALQVNESLLLFRFGTSECSSQTVLNFLIRFKKVLKRSNRFYFMRENCVRARFSHKLVLEIDSADPLHLSIRGRDIPRDLLDLIDWSEISKLEIQADNFASIVGQRDLPQLRKLTLLELSSFHPCLSLLSESECRPPHFRRMRSKISFPSQDLWIRHYGHRNLEPFRNARSSFDLHSSFRTLMTASSFERYSVKSICLKHQGRVYMKTKCGSFVTMKSANSLHLSGSTISGPSMTILSQWVGLEVLKFSPDESSSFSGLERFVHLKQLSFETNSSSRQNLELSSSGLFKLLFHQECKLEQLNLLGCDLRDEFIGHLFEALLTNSSLRCLRLWAPKISTTMTETMIDYFSSPAALLTRFQIKKWDATREIRTRLASALESNTLIEKFVASGHLFRRSIHPPLLRNFTTNRILARADIPPSLWPRLLRRIAELGENGYWYAPGKGADATYRTLRESPHAWHGVA